MLCTLTSLVWRCSEERDRRSSEGRTSVSRHFNIYISNLSCVFPWNFGSHQRVHFTEIPWKNTREIGNVNIEMPGNRCSALTRPSVSFFRTLPTYPRLQGELLIIPKHRRSNTYFIKRSPGVFGSAQPKVDERKLVY